jgi:hypothetical protein
MHLCLCVRIKPIERAGVAEIINIFSWVPRGYGQQNMYMALHKCEIINTNGGEDLEPSSQVRDVIQSA